MARANTHYVCSDCGHTEVRWYGRCPGCGAFQTMQEFREAKDRGSSRGARGYRSEAAEGPASGGAPVALREIDATQARRLPVAPAEVAGVLGGGLVEGSVVLLGGEPGVGKSTLLTGLALDWVRRGVRVLYVSGEEAPAQIRLRAERLGFDPDSEPGFEVLAETALEPLLRDLAAALDATGGGAVIIADSVQTLHSARRSTACPARRPRSAPAAGPWATSRVAAAHRCSWWATSPSPATWPARSCSSTWSTRCSTSRGRAAAPSAWCGR